MGSLCCKPSAIEDSRESPKERFSDKGGSDLRVARLNSSRREEGVRRKYSGDLRVTLIDEKVNGSKRLFDDQLEKKRREKYEIGGVNYPSIKRLPRAEEGEQVAAGWPSWLAAVAGESIKGWLPRRADTFEKLDKIGQGTYSNVYKARDILSGKIVALKKVRFDNMDPESVKFMAREIVLLRRLDHPNVIKLEGLITSKMSCSLYLVFEYMEHDLTGLASLPGIKFTEAQVKCYMHQLLSGLDHCHSRGVLHRDIKGSNLLMDNNGILKIADFGLASFFDPKHSAAMTSRVVTLWYRPPELLLGASHYGVAVDLWSTGCILGELYAGKPIMPGRTEVEQLHKIFKLCGSPSEDFWKKSKLPHAAVFKPQHPYQRCVAETFKDFPATAVRLMETLLSIDPAHRGTAARVLNSEFFTEEPLASDPSSLPKYPPSKEIDAKLRDEEDRRQRAARRAEKSRAVPAPNANAELVSSMQKRQGHSDSKSRSEIYNNHKEEVASGFAIDPPRQSQAANGVSRDSMDHRKRVFHSGPLVQGAGWAKAVKKLDDPSKAPARADLSTLSGLVATRTLSSDDHRERPGPSSQPKATKPVGRLSNSLSDWDSTRKQEQMDHTQKTASGRQMDDGRAWAKESTMHGHGSSGNKIAFSGPLSNNIDQMLREHDRQIQEFARRTRLDKAKRGKVMAQGKQVVSNPILVSSRGAG